MKTYKINNVEVSADQIKEIIKNNPELLKENKGGRYFFSKVTCKRCGQKMGIPILKRMMM